MNRHVLITGATRGIGRATARAFWRAGWRVTGVARGAAGLDALHAEFPERFVGVAADLADPTQHGRIPAADYGAVVLNAATFRPGALLTGPDVFTEQWALNVRANHLLARTQVRGMVERRAGHLVVIGSTGTDAWPEHLTAYVATKYALRGLFLGWQAELAQTPVRVSLVAPGATLTSSWNHETPPPNVLPAELVGITVLDVVTQQRTGRILLPNPPL